MEALEERSKVVDEIKRRIEKYAKQTNIKIMEALEERSKVVDEIKRRIEKYAKQTNIKIYDILVDQDYNVKIFYLYKKEEDKERFEKLCNEDPYIKRR